MGQCGSSAAAGSAVIPVWSVLALPGGDQALYGLWSCWTVWVNIWHFSFRWKPSRVPTQACSLTTLTLHWDIWMALYFTLSPPYTHSLSFISTFSLLFQEVYYSEIFKIVSSVHWLWAIFVPLPFLMIPYVAADVNMDLNGKSVCFHK